MQIEYIKNLSEGYVIDNKLYKEQITSDELFEHFYELIKNVRENEPYLYKDLTESNKFEQQKIFKFYFDTIFKPENVFTETNIDFDNLDLENLNEYADGGLFSIPLMIKIFGPVIVGGMYYFRQSSSKAFVYTLKTVFELVNKIGKSLSTAGTQTRLAYSIIQKNQSQCYIKCNFDPNEDAGPMSYALQFSKESTTKETGRMFSSEKEEETAKCLRDCYLYSIQEVIKLTAHSYFTCLRSTGDLSKLPLERDFSAYQQVLSSSKFSSSCEGLLTSLIDSFKVFDELLTLMHGDKIHEKRNQKNLLMMDIYNIQKQSLDQDNKSYQVKSFPQRQALPEKPRFQQDFNRPKQQ